jgi:hypothetical protein
MKKKKEEQDKESKSEIGWFLHCWCEKEKGKKD